MHTFLTLLKGEIRKTCLHANTYFIAAFFLLLMGFNYLSALFLCSQEASSVSPLQSLFAMFWLPTLCVLPLLTMQSFSEERRLGLLESLFSTPVGVHSVVFSKFFSTYGLYLMLWLGSLIGPCLVQHTFQEEGLWSLQQCRTVLLGGSLFIALSGFFFVSLGLLASSLTRSQPVAGLLCFIFCFVCFALPLMLPDCSPFVDWLPYIGLLNTLSDLCCGIFDLRPCLFFLLTGLLVLEITTLILEQKSLR